jgi:hypothetical protein
MNRDHLLFLCICDVLVADHDSITKKELDEWATYVVNTPVRELYTEARKVVLLGGNVNKKVIKAYLESERLQGVHECFRVVGANLENLANNQPYAKLLLELVQTTIKK